MNIQMIYLHEIHEYDEAVLFTELGHNVFSNQGAYMNPGGGPRLRPVFKTAEWPAEAELALRYPRTELPPGLIEPFDVIVIMMGHHALPIIKSNWERFKHKKIVLRMNGQSLPEQEWEIKRLRKMGLKVVRYSPAERRLDNYAGEDALIRFYKDPNEYHEWTGIDPKVINFTQSLKGRRNECHYDWVMDVGNGFPFKVYGDGNEDLEEFNGGTLPFDLMKGQMRDARCMIYSGTWPASYTLSFIEAWMTGTPIISISRDQWRIKERYDVDLFEVADLIDNDINGFVVNSIYQGKEMVQTLLNDHTLAKRISEAGRAKAIELFGKEKVKEEWGQFFRSLEVS